MDRCYIKSKFLCFTILFVCTNLIYGQNSKLSFSNGIKLKNERDYKNAILSFDEVIDENSNNHEAYLERGNIYLAIDSLDRAEEDFNMTLTIKSDNLDGVLGLARVKIKKSNYEEGEKLIEKYIQKGFSTIDLLFELSICKFGLKKFNETIILCNDYLKIKENTFKAVLLKAQCFDSLKLVQTAISSYVKAIALLNAKDDKELMQTHSISINNAITNCYINLGLYDAADTYNSKVLELNENDRIALFYNFTIANALKNQTNAINSIDKLITIEPKNLNFRNNKGILLMHNREFNDAIKLFTESIQIQDNYFARFNRSILYDSLKNFEAEIDDLEKAKLMTLQKDNIDSLILLAKKRKYDYFKESDPPIVTILNDDFGIDNIFELNDFDEPFRISVAIKDKSLIDQLLVNENLINFNKDSLNPTIEFRVKPEIEKEFVIQVCDIYFNKSQIFFKFKRGENIPPSINLQGDLSIVENEIYTVNNIDTIVKFKLQVDDESKVSELVIDNVENKNFIGRRTFETEIVLNLKGREKFNIYIKDKLGNDSLYQFKINHSQQNLGLMGRTWVVFIENTEYQFLTKLEGPKNDIHLIEQALTNYQIHKTIIKSNLSKLEMERFFSIELRNQIKKGKVESLIIWYAGHGANLQDIGYWIPVDAKIDDEFNFYSISSLKGSIMNYITLKHLLVVSDACETGLAFCRPETQNINPSCQDWEAINSKSAQVIASSNLERSSDKSGFAKVIANSLQNNSNQCLSINKIAERVLNIIGNNTQQSPRFGRIKNIEDENGTYFFIRKN
ncbi:MAG TPA: caspase family protein [Bacteroidia bacterium]|nr:caspase family protein [Bacteroidia bacterium]